MYPSLFNHARSLKTLGGSSWNQGNKITVCTAFPLLSAQSDPQETESTPREKRCSVSKALCKNITVRSCAPKLHLVTLHCDNRHLHQLNWRSPILQSLSQVQDLPTKNAVRQFYNLYTNFLLYYNCGISL